MRLTFTFITFFTVLFCHAQTVLFNNGTVARMNPGCIVFINDGDVKNNTGTLNARTETRPTNVAVIFWRRTN